jgi:hypothetical protein
MSVNRRRRRAAGSMSAAVGAFVVSVAACLGLGWSATGAGAASSGSLHRLACTPLSTDAPLEAPLYARNDGAGGGTDEWWCELPHATQVPQKYVELKRLVFPLSYPYSGYATYYGPPGDATSAGDPGTPGVVVTDNVNSAPTAPKRLSYPVQPKGQQVSIAKGVKGTVVKAGDTVTVSWRYPTNGVPRYLGGVAAVKVTGTDVPRALVLAVARHVTPN